LCRGAEKVLNLTSAFLKNQVSDRIIFAVQFPGIDDYNKSAKTVSGNILPHRDFLLKLHGRSLMIKQ